MDEQKKRRIGNITAGCMLALAFLFDVIQVPLTVTVVLPIIVGFIAALIFGIWFKVLNVQYFQGKRAFLKLLSFSAPLIISIVPLINDIPDITAGVLGTIVLVTLEDKEFIPPSVDPKKVAAARRAAQQKQMLTDRAMLEQAATLPTEEEAA